MPLPTLPQALSKNAVDGALVPFEIFPAFKIHNLTKHSIVGPNDSRFGTSVFIMLMNKDKFNSMPKDLQDIVEKSLDMEMVKKAGQLWMDFEKPGIEKQKSSKGSDVTALSEESMKEFNKAGQRVVQKWISEVKEKGIDGEKLVNEARKAINANTK